MFYSIIQNKQIAAGIYDLRLSFEAGKPVPGSFLHIACGSGLLLRRPISLCGIKDGEARLVYAVRGEGTRWLSRQPAGRRLDVLGPLGKGFDCSDNIKTLLIGGGIGVPPMLYCAEILSDTHALLGFKDERSIILAGEFPSRDIFLGENYPHERIKELDYKRVFACGPKPMLRAVAEECEKLGIQCFVSMEERMACGVGACLVCACAVRDGENRRVCMDGPVFDAREVDWNE